MQENLAYIITYILAGFGALTLVHMIIDTINFKMANDSSSIRLALIVKNKQDEIEGVIRNIFRSGILNRSGIGGSLIVLDLGSQDETVALLEKLKRDYEYIEVIEDSEKERIFDTLKAKELENTP